MGGIHLRDSGADDGGDPVTTEGWVERTPQALTERAVMVFRAVMAQIALETSEAFLAELRHRDRTRQDSAPRPGRQPRPGPPRAMGVRPPPRSHQRRGR